MTTHTPTARWVPDVLDRALLAAGPRRTGQVTRVVGLNLEVAGISVAVGDAVEVDTAAGALPAEAVALTDDGAICLPYGELTGCGPAPPAPRPAAR